MVEVDSVPVMVGAAERTTDPVPVEAPVMAMVPEEVMGDPETERKDGTEIPTEVTDPVEGEPHVDPPEPLEMRT